MEEREGLPIGVEAVQFEDPPETDVDDAQELEEVEAHTVLDLAEDFAFFTTALVFTHGRSDRDPLALFNQAHWEEDPNLRPFAIDCEYPFFQHVGKTVVNGELVDWDRRLYGIVKPRWELCRNFVSSITMFESATHHYARVGWHDLRIVDPTTLHDGRMLKELPVIDIVVFIVSTNRGLTYMEPAADPPRTLAYPKTNSPDNKLVTEADAALGPPPDARRLAEDLSKKAQEEE